MENQNEISAQEALKQMAISQAASTYQWAEAIPADMRPLILEAKVKQTLDKMNASLEVVNGEVQIHRKDNPGMQVFDENQGKLTMQQLVNRALGIQQPAVNKKEGPYYQQLSDSEFVKGGVRHVRLGNNSYADPIDNRFANRQGPTGRTFEEHKAQLDKELDIRP